MATPKPDTKRDQILAAATRVIAMHGVAAPTAAIAKEAGVANGSLFNAFPTKADLLNHLYRELKSERAVLSMEDMPATADLRARSLHMWNRTLHWATTYPDKRRVLARLGVSEEITPETLEYGHQVMAPIARLLDESRRNGPMRDAPLPFLANILGALTETTADYMIRDPANAETHCAAGFEALWRIVA